MITDPEAARFVASRSSSAGVFTEPGEAQPTLEATRFGVEALVALGGTPREATLDFVENCWRPGGGFAMLAGEAEISVEEAQTSMSTSETDGSPMKKVASPASARRVWR